MDAHSAAKFDAPNTNGKIFHKTSYSEWNKNTRRATEPNSRNARKENGARYNHQGRRNNHKQDYNWSPSASPQGSPIPAPSSPQWQQQVTPATDASFSSFQEQQGPVAVNLSDLPPALCRSVFLEAMLDQAGLADEIIGCVLGEVQDSGKAVIYLTSYQSALKCVQHFDSRRWANTGPPVTARVAEGHSQTPKPAASGHQGSPANKLVSAPHQSPQNARTMAPASRGYPAPPTYVLEQPALPILPAQEYCKGNGSNSPKSGSSNASDSPKTRWADLVEDEDKEHDHSEDSTSAGSTGRSRQQTGESPFFSGCDVDTDDGF